MGREIGGRVGGKESKENISSILETMSLRYMTNIQVATRLDN